MRRHGRKGAAVLAIAVGAAASTAAEAKSPADLDPGRIQAEKARPEARVALARIVMMRALERMLRQGQASQNTLAQWYNWPNWNNWYNQWRNY
jgi:hypothetical protein